MTLLGCSLNDLGKARQDMACKDSGGVYSYVSFGSAICLDGSKVFGWEDLILTPEFYPAKPVESHITIN